MSEKLIAFFFIVKNSEGIIDVSVIHQSLAYLFEKFGFVRANKNITKYWADMRTPSHAIKFPVHDIIKIEFN